MRRKLGLTTAHDNDGALIDGILHLLADNAVDYTIFWRRLAQAMASGNHEPVRDLFADRAGFDRWMLLYSEHAALDGIALDANLMLKNNPHAGFEAYADFPPDWAQHLSISCSS